MEVNLAGGRNALKNAALAPRPRVAFAGLGWIGHQRMCSLMERQLVEVAALADPSEESLDRARATAPNAYARRELEELLTSGIEGIVIATPSALHAPQALLALEHGVAVFCQKPLGRNADETRQVVQMAEDRDRLLAVDFSYRHVQGLQQIRERVLDGAIGEVFATRAVFHNAYGPGKDWFYDKGSSGGGCVIDLGIHLVDIILWTLSFPEVDCITSRLYAGGQPQRGHANAVEDYAVARLDLSSGAVAEIACSWNLSTGCDAVIEVDFFGTDGSVSLRNVDGSYVDFIARHCRGRSEEIIAEPPDDWGGGAIVQWAERLNRSTSFDPDIWKVVQVAEAIDGIYSAALT